MATPKSTPAIECRDLAVAYEAGDPAIEGIDVTIEAGEFVTVIGPSGVGKTTLLRAIGGLESPSAGMVRLDGEPPRVAQQGGQLGFVFQEHALLEWKTALENVTFLRSLTGRDPDPSGARDVLERAGLGDAMDRYPSELSGGMKQRVALARALHLEASLLLMDEPFGSLDELTREQMSLELAELWRATDRTVIFVTHSVPEAVLLGQRCFVMADSPGTIAKDIDIDLPPVGDARTLESASFHDAVTHLRQALRAVTDQ